MATGTGAGMAKVCEEQQLTVVGRAHLCVQAFTHTVKLWKQGCRGPRWCAGYERRTRYTIYRLVYSVEQQTIYKCCPGWSRRHSELGCLHAISAVGTRFNRERCSDHGAQWCPCTEGFHGPCCQYDKNECAIDNGGCQDRCCNTIGSYYCKCQAGQKLEEDGRGCEDVDECVVVNRGCQQHCINSPGTFHCECGMGYRLRADEHTCIKMDPCTGGNGCANICQSESGVAGYQLPEDKKACGDINECAEGLAPSGHHCVNTTGSFTCACHPGFELGADEKCYRIEFEIVNSCEENNGGCSHHCEHAIGGLCSCNHGHQFDSDKKTCIDLDECESGEACCAQLCVNYLGGYECGCKEGFRISPDGCGYDGKFLRSNTKYVDECLDVSIVCDQLCINSVGTYDCTCEEGYRIGSDRKTCIACLIQALSCMVLTLDDDWLEEEEELEVLCKAIMAQPRWYHIPVCLDDTFGHDCSSSCQDCRNGGKCQEGRSRSTCLASWGGLFCQETCSPETSGKECGSICHCQSGGTCDALTGQRQCPSGIPGATCEDRCLKGFFGKNCKRKCNCANNGHCHRVYGACMCKPGRYGRFCHLNCPKGACGAGCSSECQCVEENTLAGKAKNGTRTCKSGYQGNRCQEGTI
ncbi:LOW QUALITY PROTEIN: uncharacterized protein ACIGJ3_022385 [Trichechus inunguis]